MKNTKIIVETESADLWWGIYELNEKTGWEDITLFDVHGEKIGSFCLCTKSYLRSVLEDLINDESEREFTDMIQNHLAGNICNYWFCYDEIGDDDFYEVSYDAPENDKGVKPCYIEVFHPDEGIDLDTITSAVSTFAEKFLKIENCTVEIIYDVSLEESIRSFKEYQQRFGDGNMNVLFSDELISELTERWKIKKEQVLDKLNVSI